MLLTDGPTRCIVGGMKGKGMHIRFEPDAIMAINKEAARLNLSMASIVRMYVREGMRHRIEFVPLEAEPVSAGARER